MSTPDRIREALASYTGPFDVCLPVHPSTLDALGYRLDQLAIHIAAALATDTAPEEYTRDRHPKETCLYPDAHRLTDPLAHDWTWNRP